MKKVPIPDIHHFVWGTYPSRLGCLQAPNNWPRQLGSIARAPISDYSCTAESSHVIPGKIDKAIAAGDIHRGTRAIVIAVGINDFGPYGIQRGAQPFNAAKMRSSSRLRRNLRGNDAPVAPPQHLRSGLPALGRRRHRPPRPAQSGTAPDASWLAVHGGGDFPPPVVVPAETGGFEPPEV